MERFIVISEGKLIMENLAGLHSLESEVAGEGSRRARLPGAKVRCLAEIMEFFSRQGLMKHSSICAPFG